ncbi:MAG: hypothetical protein V1895_03455 [Parcubacteria group bacterium]
MSAIPVPPPPEPLTPHEQALILVKSRPPQPTKLYYLIAALTFIGGILMGWIYLVKDGTKNKLFGLRALLLGFLLPLVVVAVILVIQINQRGEQAPLPQQPGKILPK